MTQTSTTSGVLAPARVHTVTSQPSLESLPPAVFSAPTSSAAGAPAVGPNSAAAQHAAAAAALQGQALVTPLGPPLGSGLPGAASSSVTFLLNGHHALANGIAGTGHDSPLATSPGGAVGTPSATIAGSAFSISALHEKFSDLGAKLASEQAATHAAKEEAERERARAAEAVARLRVALNQLAAIAPHSPVAGAPAAGTNGMTVAVDGGLSPAAGVGVGEDGGDGVDYCATPPSGAIATLPAVPMPTTHARQLAFTQVGLRCNCQCIRRWQACCLSVWPACAPHTHLTIVRCAF